jgi:hypothetical protein
LNNPLIYTDPDGKFGFPVGLAYKMYTAMTLTVIENIGKPFNESFTKDISGRIGQAIIGGEISFGLSAGKALGEIGLASIGGSISENGETSESGKF